MAVIGTLLLELGIDTSKFHAGLENAEKESKGFAGTTGGFLSNALSFATGGAILNGLGFVADKIKGVAGAMIDGNAEFETYQTQFGVLLKSSTAAKQRLEELAKFGASTPFELPELVRADKILTAFGLDSEDTAKRFGVSGAQIRTTIGDVAAGTGTSFEELSTTFGKFASGATGDAIARFQELGIATKEEMASWGLEFSKSGQLLTPTQEAFTILEKHVRDKFGGMMDAQSKTFSGMVSNLQDWAGQTLRTMGQPIFEVVKDKLGVLLDFLNRPETQATMNKIAKVLADDIGKAMDWLSNKGIPALVNAWTTIQPTLNTFLKVGGSIATFIGDNLKPIMVGLGTVLAIVVIPAFISWAIAAGAAAVATIAALAPVLIPLAAIGVAVGLLYKAWDSDWGGIRTTLTDFWNNDAKPIFDGFVRIFTEKIPNAWNSLKQKWDDFIGWIKGALASIPGGDWIISKLGGTPPGRAIGGPVIGGQPYTVGERGPEMFVPAVNGTIIPNGATGSASITINVQGSVISERDLAQMVREELLAFKRRNPTAGLA